MFTSNYNVNTRPFTEFNKSVTKNWILDNIYGLITNTMCYISSTKGVTRENSIQIYLSSEHIIVSIMVLSLGLNYAVILQTELGRHKFWNAETLYEEAVNSAFFLFDLCWSLGLLLEAEICGYIYRRNVRWLSHGLHGIKY
jgi:hypothetical protein